MDNIIALIVAGFALLIFVLIFQKRNNKGVQQFLKDNKNVEPLFKETSAKNKYQALYNTFKYQPQAREALAKLHADYADKKISVTAYHDALDELDERYAKL